MRRSGAQVWWEGQHTCAGCGDHGGTVWLLPSARRDEGFLLHSMVSPVASRTGPEC